MRDFARPQKLRVNRYYYTVAAHKLFINAFPNEFKVRKTSLAKSLKQEILNSDAMLGCNYEVGGIFLIVNKPKGPNEVFGMTPVPFGIEIAQVKFLLKSEFNPCGCFGYLTCYESLMSQGAFVVK